MKNRALISVIMASYSGDDLVHLRHAVESILKQSYQNIELIIVIDGAISDAHEDYFKSLANSTTTSKLKLHSLSENVGPAAARNIAIANAKGDFIAIMDADDVSEPTRLEVQLMYLLENDLDLISSSLKLIDDEDQIIGERVLPTSPEKIKTLSAYRCPLHNPSAFAKASVFKENSYKVEYRVCEDYDLWVSLLRKGYLLGNTAQYCVSYRQSKKAVSRRTGFHYAFADFKIKCRALMFLPIYERPIAVILAVLTSLIRLLPFTLFTMVYKMKDKLLNSFFHSKRGR